MNTTQLLSLLLTLSPREHTFGIAILLGLQSSIPIHQSCVQSFVTFVKQFFEFANKDEFIIACNEGFL